MPYELLTIGELARLTGRRASAIRYYEEIGLLPEPIRRSGQRRYDQGSVRKLAVIDTAQRAGLALDEIKALLQAAPGDDAATVEHLRQAAERKLPQVAATTRRFQHLRRSPTTLRSWDCGGQARLTGRGESCGGPRQGR